jgi:5-hydroxyisourate hydrolase-like protein (transthyretin family)
MKINLFLFAVLFSTAFISCKKGIAEFTLTGTVNDQTMNAPMVGATVRLYATEAGGVNTDQIASTTTDAQGNYSFTFARDKIETYHIRIEKPNYFETYVDIPFSSLTIEEQNIRNYSVKAKAWIKFHFTNSNPQITDVLEFIKQEGKVDCDECCPGGYRYYYGAVDTTFYCINDGNTPYSGYYWVQGTANQGPLWVVSPAFDTVEISLNY